MKRDREWYWRRAKRKFKWLVVYFCVTRPQYERGYKDPQTGEFSIKELLRQLDFIGDWKNKTSQFRKQRAREYAEYSRTFNYTFGIPSALIKDVLGKMKDDDGKFRNVPINKLVKELKDEGFLSVKPHGTHTHKDDDGKHHVDYWWSNKYFIANKKYWMRLLKNPKFGDYQKWPNDNDGIVAEVREKIAKWRTVATSRQSETKNDVSEVLKSFASGNLSPKIAVYELSKLGLSEEKSIHILGEIQKRMNGS